MFIYTYIYILAMNLYLSEFKCNELHAVQSIKTKQKFLTNSEYWRLLHRGKIQVNINET